MLSRPMRAVLLYTATLDPEKQERILLKWATERRYLVTAITASPEAARTLAVDGLVEVVVVVQHTAATLVQTMEIIAAGVAVDEIRPRREGPSRQELRIVEAAQRGASPEHIATVLGLPLTTVLEALGSQAVRSTPASNVRRLEVARRPRETGRDREVTRPGGRR